MGRPTTSPTGRAGPMLHRSVLPGLRAESQARIDGTKTSHRYQRGQILHYQDNPCGGVHSIVTGRAKLVRASASGRRCILRIATPGDLLGLDALLSAGRTYSTTAQMLEAGIVSFVERDVVLDVIRADPSAAEAIFAMLAEWVHVADEERAELVGSGVRERTARVLVRLAKDHGVAVGAGLLVRPQLTREELAEMVGSAAETVTRQLTEFRESDLVQLDGRRIVVTDLERLTRVAHLADPLFPDEHHVVS